ncbi:mannosyltransferase [Vararia minispora EC-137]|uniref:Mannosyltransferase n=1 Tax=Vararia minispora EC-137 TaxID=1314806 RepID=A0ACB8QWP6_9AGAM|nr:mannosyltransferase [Vararia minispora EC-137]
MILLPFLLYIVTPITLAYIFHARKLRKSRNNQVDGVRKALNLESVSGKKFVGFFHPYCNAGGGGERVLWTAIAFMQRTQPDVISVVYSGDVDASKEQIVEKVKSRFDIGLSASSLHFVFLHSRRLVEDKTWPRFTLLAQSLGSMYLAWEAMSKFIPDLYVDTMGYAFTFPVVAWLTGVPIGAYVHYPTISTDMLARVEARTSWHTNSDSISSSPVLSSGKLFYYRAFMYIYSRCLRRADFLMVNSTWTKNHIDSILQHTDGLFDTLDSAAEALLTPFAIIASLSLPTPASHPHKMPKEALRIYPPCDTRSMASFPLEGRERIILSIAQFRPEKDHAMQIKALDALLRAHPEYKSSPHPLRLVLIGGVRNDGDRARVEGLQTLARDLGVSDFLEFIVNASYQDMLTYLSRSSVGIHTMVDEHFGINVVEFMAAGVIPVAHASAGPFLDIVLPVDGMPTGFHARTVDEFAQALHDALSLSSTDDIAMRKRGRESAVQRFSELEFEKGWEASGWKRWLR